MRNLKCAVFALAAMFAASSEATDIRVATRDWVNNQISNKIAEIVGNLTNGVPSVVRKPDIFDFRTDPNALARTEISVDEDHGRVTYTSRASFKNEPIDIELTSQAPTNRSIVLYASPSVSPLLARNVGYLMYSENRFVNPAASYITSITASNDVVDVVTTNTYGVVSATQMKTVFLRATAVDGTQYAGQTYENIGWMACVTNSDVGILFRLTYSFDRAEQSMSWVKRALGTLFGASESGGDEKTGKWQIEYDYDTQTYSMRIQTVVYQRGRKLVTYDIDLSDQLSMEVFTDFPPETTEHTCDIDAANNCICKYTNKTCTESDYPEHLKDPYLSDVKEDAQKFETYYPSDTLATERTPTGDGGYEDVKGLAYVDSAGEQHVLPISIIEGSDAFKSASGRIVEKIASRASTLRNSFAKYYTCDKGGIEQHTKSEKKCGAYSWWMCTRNHAHKGGTEQHDYQGHSFGHVCKCEDRRVAPGAGEWNKGQKNLSATGWTRQDTCKVSGCSEKRTVNHTCSHDKCDYCTATIPEDDDAVCGDKCHTCEATGGERHNFSGGGGGSCAHCSCSGCGISPYDAYQREDTFADLFAEELHGWIDNGCSEHHNGNNEFSGAHCLCKCGIYDCSKGIGVLFHQFGDSIDPIYWEIPDTENHWKCDRGDCTRCGARYGEKEPHNYELLDGQNWPYKFIDNDHCAPMKSCQSPGCGYTPEITEDQYEGHEPVSETPDYCSYQSDSVCRHYFTCKKCGESFYNDDVCSHDPDPETCYCKCPGCDYAKHNYQDSACGNRECSRCHQHDPESGPETHSGCINAGGTHHCNCFVAGQCGKSEGHPWGNREVISETETEITYRYHCTGSSWGGGACEATKDETLQKNPPPDECADPESSDPDDHTPIGTHCGCCCGKIGTGSEYEDFHAFVGTGCRCECGGWHVAQSGNVCDGVCAGGCNTKKANSGSQLYANAPDADEDDHTPATDHCGCKCGHLTHTADAAKWHKEYPGKCRCYGGSGDGHGAWHFHHPSACTRVCAMKIGNSSHKVSTGDPSRETANRPTVVGDHDKTGLPRCGCSCGEYGGEDGKDVPEECNLHNFALQNACYCYCGKKENPSTAVAAHTFEDGSCICTCGTMHKCTGINEQCPGVCTGCDGKYKSQSGVTLELIATDADHTKCDGGRCGCACGKYNNTITSDLFHNFDDDNGSCFCYCRVKPRPTTDWARHKYSGDCKCSCNKCHKGEASECENVCTCGISMNTHLIVAGTDQAAPGTDHTKGAYTDSCGCLCGAYMSGGAGKAPTANLHISKSGHCKCNCNETFNPDSTQHSYTRAGGLTQLPCICDCGNKHRGTADTDCPGRCLYCVRKTDDTDGTQETPAPESAHTPKSDGCGCCCGTVKSTTNTDDFHHNTPSAQSCKCSCTKKTLEHRYSTDSTCCNCYCGQGPKKHVFESGHCKCKCGEKLGGGGHVSVDGQCKCQCGAVIKSHVEVAGHCKCQCGNTVINHVSVSGQCKCQCGETSIHQFAQEYNDRCYVCYCGQQKRHNRATGNCYCYCGETLAEGGHVSKNGQCECQCGETIPAHKSPSTDRTQCNTCYCGQDKEHNRRPGSCYCYCGEQIVEHIAVNGHCKCLCGQHVFGHVFTSGSCRCQCGGTVDHRWGTTSSRSCNSCYCGAQTVHHASDSACHCWCGDTFTGHKFRSNSCTCYCGESKSHKTPEGSCRCYCGDIHHSTYARAGCTRICDKCGMLLSDPSKTPTKGDHTPKGNGCGCKCGGYSASAYDPADYPSYHGGSGSPSCRCQCGATHRGFQASSCPSACAVCHMNRAMTVSDPTIHTFYQSCHCNCGTYTEHAYATDSCYCYCHDRFRGHDWNHGTDTQTHDHCNVCDYDIIKHHQVYTCNRCGTEETSDWEEGHGYPCIDDEDTPTEPTHGGCTGSCGCTDCDCTACQIGDGTCSYCGGVCGGGSEGGGSGGGESGGEGGLDDI